MLTKRVLGGIGTGMLKIISKKWFVSLIYEGISGTRGFIKWSTKEDSLSVGESQPDIMGRPGMLGLCILGRRYRGGVRGGFFGSKYL